MSHLVPLSEAGAIDALHDDLLVRAINLRIATAGGTVVDRGESSITLRYTTG
jgi:hypothetical protein